MQLKSLYFDSLEFACGDHAICTLGPHALSVRNSQSYQQNILHVFLVKMIIHDHYVSRY